MSIQQSASPESILRNALEVARDELKRVNDHYACVRPDPFGVVVQALAAVPPLPPIPNASEVEKRIIGKLVTDLLDAGFHITVNDGEEDCVERSIDSDAIYKALCSTDADRLYVYRSQNSARADGWVYLVWGNDDAVISDYTTNLDPQVGPAQELAESLL